MALIPYPGSKAARIRNTINYVKYRREGSDKLTDLELTIRSLQNRVNESRNRGGLAVPVALTTLSKALTLLKKEKPARPYVPISSMIHDPYRLCCGKCTQTMVLVGGRKKPGDLKEIYKYCPRCGVKIDWKEW